MVGAGLGTLRGVCTVLLRFAPDGPWPILLGAVRDEFVDRPWDPPAGHWPDRPGLVGGRDRAAGGTWLAVDPSRRAVAALLNGYPLGRPADGGRPTRGTLALDLLSGGERAVPGPGEVTRYDTFHLLHATLDRGVVWSWDGVEMTRTDLTPGDHILVNAGVDAVDDPLVPHFMPVLDKVPSVAPRPGLPTDLAWDGWLALLAGDGLDPADDRALIVARTIAGVGYGSTSVTLVGLSPDTVRYDFTDRPGREDGWWEIPVMAAGGLPRTPGRG